ncbi:MAG: Heptaprenyl diphosphate synthase component 2 [Chloroflexi bacterium ADurb.Bin180]|nr:MAG: Heptaprenyl diphosphate synthase component 2 [Chloroflexi bacterium ADurb.Bin180]
MNRRSHPIPPLRAVQPELDQVEGLLQAAIADAGEQLRRAVLPHLSGGKRLRAGLILLLGRQLDAPVGPLCRLAAAVEMLHAATLVHDDIIDGADLRRGVPTLHSLLPTSAAILAGDYLFARSVALVAELENPRLLGSLAEGLKRTSAGEIEEALRGGPGGRSKSQYYRSIEAKTAALFAASAAMAAMVAGADDKTVRTCGAFGRELGLAFQVVDDVLDLDGSPDRLGKPAGGDLRQGLATLPVLLFLEQGEDTESIRRILAGDGDQALLEAAIRDIRASGALDQAMAEARRFSAQAKCLLDTLPGGAASADLASLLDYVVERRA